MEEARHQKVTEALAGISIMIPPVITECYNQMAHFTRIVVVPQGGTLLVDFIEWLQSNCHLLLTLKTSIPGEDFS